MSSTSAPAATVGAALSESFRASFRAFVPLGLVVMAALVGDALLKISFLSLLITPFLVTAAMRDLRDHEELSLPGVVNAMLARIKDYITTFFASVLLVIAAVLPFVIAVVVAAVLIGSNLNKVTDFDSNSLIISSSGGTIGADGLPNIDSVTPFVDSISGQLTDNLTGALVAILLFFVFLAVVIYVSTRLSFAYYAAYEGHGFFDAFRRSLRVSKGAVLRTLGWNLVAALVGLVISIPFASVAAMAGNVTLAVVVTAAASAITTMLSIRMNATLYLDQKRINAIAD